MTGYITIMYKFILIFRMCVYLNLIDFQILCYFFQPLLYPGNRKAGVAILVPALADQLFHGS